MKRSLATFFWLVAVTAVADLAPVQRFRSNVQKPLEGRDLTMMQFSSQSLYWTFDEALETNVNLTAVKSLTGATSITFVYSPADRSWKKEIAGLLTDYYSPGTNGTTNVVSNGSIYFSFLPTNLTVNSLNGNFDYVISVKNATKTLAYAQGSLTIKENVDYSTGDVGSVAPNVIDWIRYTGYSNTAAYGPSRAGAGIKVTTNADGSITFLPNVLPFAKAPTNSPQAGYALLSDGTTSNLYFGAAGGGAGAVFNVSGGLLVWNGTNLTLTSNSVQAAVAAGTELDPQWWSWFATNSLFALWNQAYVWANPTNLYLTPVSTQGLLMATGSAGSLSNFPSVVVQTNQTDVTFAGIRFYLDGSGKHIAPIDVAPITGFLDDNDGSPAIEFEEDKRYLTGVGGRSAFWGTSAGFSVGPNNGTDTLVHVSITNLSAQVAGKVSTNGSAAGLTNWPAVVVQTNVLDVTIGKWRLASGPASSSRLYAKGSVGGLYASNNVVAFSFSDSTRRLYGTNGVANATFDDVWQFGPNAGTDVMAYAEATNIRVRIGTLESNTATLAQGVAATNAQALIGLETLQKVVNRGGTATNTTVTIDAANVKTNTYGGKVAVIGQSVRTKGSTVWANPLSADEGSWAINGGTVLGENSYGFSGCTISGNASWGYGYSTIAGDGSWGFLDSVVSGNSSWGFNASGASNDYCWVWGGPPNVYGSHGDGTWNFNTSNGLYAMWLGEECLGNIIITNNATSPNFMTSATIDGHTVLTNTAVFGVSELIVGTVTNTGSITFKGSRVSATGGSIMFTNIEYVGNTIVPDLATPQTYEYIWYPPRDEQITLLKVQARAVPYQTTFSVCYNASNSLWRSSVTTNQANIQADPTGVTVTNFTSAIIPAGNWWGIRVEMASDPRATSLSYSLKIGY